MRSIRLIIWAALAGNVSLYSLHAETAEIVISATKIETSRDKVASSISVINQESINNTQTSEVAPMLQGENGVDIITSGAQGGNAAVFIRGANPEHTLVLIDGVEANSSINPTRAFNFSDLATDNIERIEILRGPQSTLYGSDAMGGVINIITKKGTNEKEAFASIEAGTYNTLISKAGLSGIKENLNYSLGASRKDSDNISSARGGSEEDPFQNSSLSLRLGTENAENINSKLFLRYNDSRAELDNFGGEFGDDPNRIFRNEQIFSRAEVQPIIAKDLFEPLLGINYTRQDYSDDNYIDELNPFDTLDSDYQGEQLKFTLQNNTEINDNFSMLLGAETEDESGESDYASQSAFGPYTDNFSPDSVRTTGYYAQLTNYIGDNFSANYGIRADDHENFGSKVTWRVAPQYQLGDTRIRGTVGTGFKAPSLFQLYSVYGSEDLKPEESLGYDFGIDQNIFNKKGKVGITYFHNDFDELISFDPQTFLFENISEAETSGLEFYLSGDITNEFNLRSSYTYTDTEDLNTEESLLRRPRNKARLEGTYSLNDQTTLTAAVIMVGSKFDNDFSTFPASRSKIAGYSIVNLYARYKINSDYELFARIENLFDKEYEDVLGYGTLGTNAIAGLKVNL